MLQLSEAEKKVIIYLAKEGHADIYTIQKNCDLTADDVVVIPEKFVRVVAPPLLMKMTIQGHVESENNSSPYVLTGEGRRIAAYLLRPWYAKPIIWSFIAAIGAIATAVFTGMMAFNL